MAGIFGSTVLDVAIGLVFVYLLLAILCTSANELLSGLTKSRASFLKRGITQLLDNQPTGDAKDQTKAFLEEFYKHPLITGMMQGNRHPAYLPSRTFATVITDNLAKNRVGRLNIEELEAGIMGMPDGDVKQALIALVHTSGYDLDSALTAIEGWFEDAMDRVTGWYKRRTQIWTLIMAILVTVLANADTVHIARRLWRDPVLRGAVVEAAKNRAQKPRPSVTVEYPDPDDPTNPTIASNEGNTVAPEENALLGQMIGWQGALTDNTARDWFERTLGWLLTILAICLGAPFWFDLLNKFVNIRSAGKSPDEAAKKPEKKKLAPADKSA
jgi:hypothetical protein